ncbi:hypothetical protein BWQ96_06610 [Gracilariopsis chorda]|uniref:Uncharacterized protein n=1 Tax=Gracilariopsis chorda TaxID=448386 RepID=A0A2V3INI6_9FLOR|nr:hypothetical protein BWQ96_06610 [Gracilariopsis chorda]|eukprot:PXF43651.1 hypothetical protein BWQ96_06610 [Gracilariopsis chorda]
MALAIWWHDLRIMGATYTPLSSTGVAKTSHSSEGGATGSVSVTIGTPALDASRGGTAISAGRLTLGATAAGKNVSVPPEWEEEHCRVLSCRGTSRLNKVLNTARNSRKSQLNVFMCTATNGKSSSIRKIVCNSPMGDSFRNSLEEERGKTLLVIHTCRMAGYGLEVVPAVTIRKIPWRVRPFHLEHITQQGFNAICSSPQQVLNPSPKKVDNHHPPETHDMTHWAAARALITTDLVIYGAYVAADAVPAEI